MLKEGSAETEPLPANPRRATVAATNAKVRMEDVFIFIIVRIRWKHIRSNGVCTPWSLVELPDSLTSSNNYWSRTMETVVEKDSPVTALVILGSILLFFVGGGLGLAYVGGVFTGKDAVAENDKRIANQALVKSVPPAAPEPAKP